MRYVNWGVVSRHLARTYFLIKLSFLFSLSLSLSYRTVAALHFYILINRASTNDPGSTPKSP